MTSKSVICEMEARHLEVLTSDFNGQVVGYVYRGARPGPNVLVAGHGAFAEDVYDRLLNLPTLPWLRGTITMVWMAGSDPTKHLPSELFPEEHGYDEVLYLPFGSAQGPASRAQKHAYYTVLRLCTRLGMIEGRGVSQFIPSEAGQSHAPEQRV